MEEDLALLISKQYLGDLVTSDEQDKSNFVIDVRRINSLMVSVQFKLNGQETQFRAMLSRQHEGILLRIQEKISGDHLIKGVSGFLYGKPNIHGGFLHHLNGFYFHISKSFFDQQEKDIYFLGKVHQHQVKQEQAPLLFDLASH